MLLITCPKMMSTITKNGLPPLWIASPPWIGHNGSPRA